MLCLKNCKLDVSIRDCAERKDFISLGSVSCFDIKVPQAAKLSSLTVNCVWILSLNSPEIRKVHRYFFSLLHFGENTLFWKAHSSGNHLSVM